MVSSLKLGRRLSALTVRLPVIPKDCCCHISFEARTGVAENVLTLCGLQTNDDTQ